jgi:predicted regulator of Ras-like GTPase activity (Roadblock/LC7/MglB family)
VENVAKLPGVSGAVVAMKEGLLVAQRLPEHLNGEAFAAFLPQIFARLNQYAGEMKLGEVNELTINTQGAPCQMFRLGEVLFAAVGRTGEPLPSQALSLCAAQIKN